MPSNIEQVIADIEDFKHDLRNQLRRRVARAMRVLEADARTYIKQDADWRGHLARSLSMDVERDADGVTIVVSAGGAEAPYAPFVEFGTGSRTERTTDAAPSSNLLVGGMKPPGYPYKSPDMSPGMVANIIEWVRTKSITSPNENAEQLGFRIASVIANRGTYAHPFMRPAWFHNELRVRQAARNAIRRAT